MPIEHRMRRSDRHAGPRRWLLVGVSVAALAASGGVGLSRPLNGGSGGTGAPSAAAAAAAAAAAQTRQGAQAAKRSRDSLSRATQAIQAMRATQDAARAAAAARPSTVPNGLGAGGLQPAVTAPRPAALDPTGIKTWEGAKLPTQVVTGKRHDVTVEQTKSRAVLSWETFNVGKDTTLTFDQDGNKDWVVLNRVVGGLDERGRRTAQLKPSQILGSIKADGTVLVMNQNGVIFGGGSQIRTTSLGVSTAEIGRGFRTIGAFKTDGTNEFQALTLAERNAEFLQFGLLGVRDSLRTDAERAFHSEFTAQYEDVRRVDFNNPGVGFRDVIRETDAPSGGVFVEAGARIEGGSGGFVLLNSTRVENAGTIVAPEGNVSLVAQFGASLIASDGSSKAGNNPNYRGLAGFAPTSKIAPTGAFFENGQNVYLNENAIPVPINTDVGEVYGRNTGLIEANRGSIRVTENSGVLSSTTSVARNGYISVDRAMAGSVISITADPGEETVPQDPLSLANFKSSRIDIGYYVGTDALIVAPGGDVVFTGPPPVATGSGAPVRTLIESGAVIDVGGLRDVLIPASRNAIRIGPLKGNELADNPEYRDSFLNGATVYVDPRRSGVREDGVAWVGSPLIEAESYYQQVGVRAEELLTRGGNVRFAGPSSTTGATGATASDTIVEAGAVIDISGGSVVYEGGRVRTSKLIGADGRLYDIADADPLKMSFVGFAAGFTVTHSRAGIIESYASPLRPNTRTELAYAEGRDGGTLDLPDGVLAFAGSVKAGVVVGDRQARDAVEGTGESAIGWDQRAVQGAPSQLPVGGALRIGGDPLDTDSPINGVTIVAGADLPALPDVGYGRDFGVIDAGRLPVPGANVGGVTGPRDPGSELPDDRLGATLLSSDMLSEAGFGQIEIARRGDITIESGATVRLADGGIFTAASGGSIRVDGSIIAASGVVSLETSGQSNLRTGIAEIPEGYSPWNVVVNGTISVRGRWVNDFAAPRGSDQGGAYLDGGTISLYAGTGAGTIDFNADPNTIKDISGSVLVNAGATLDLAGGGRVDREGAIDTSARGGSLALISEAGYFQVRDNGSSVSYLPLHVRGSTGGDATINQPIPDKIIAKVSIDSGATVLSHGFGGGGTFQLVTPEFSFGDGVAEVGTQLSTGFITTQGFSNYDITSFKTKIVENKFRDFPGDTRARGYDGFLATQTVTIGAGETLRLRNSVFSLLPSDRSVGDTAALRSLGSGGDLYSVLETTTLEDTPGRDNAFYRQPVSLTLGGAIELKVAEGGAIIGEAGARLGASRLINEGLIRLPGGEILVEGQRMSSVFAGNGIAGGDPYAGLTPEADGTYAEFTTSADGVRSNVDAYVGYLLGELPADVGLALREGSVTDLAGVSLRDPLARTGSRAGDDLADGRILAGGRIVTAAAAERRDTFRLYDTSPFARFAGGGRPSVNDPKTILGLKVVASPGASIDISGASDVYGRPAPGGALGGGGPAIATPVWSDAGAIVALNGGTLTGAVIDARGGSAKARGGTLEIRDLVLTQTDTDAPAENTVSADQITRSGFDVVHARGSVTSLGDVDLTLDRGFFLSTAEIFDQNDSNGAGSQQLYARIGSGGSLSIVAPYVRLEGFAQTLPGLPGGEAGTNSVRFTGDQVDVVGAVSFDQTVGSADIVARGDIRLLGQSDIRRRLPSDAFVSKPTFTDAISMQLAAYGDLTLTADRIYPETGTTARITSSGLDSTITFARPSGPAPKTPYSAGAKLTVQAANIAQNGAIFTPHGTLTLGSTADLIDRDSSGAQTVLAPATKTVTLGAGSLTSVSGGTISIPYGVTTDLTEYFFTPSSGEALEGTPEKRLVLGGGELSVETGATIDVSGGGDLFAYEFIPGTGGSRDVLDRLNPDDFSSNDGELYPDGRQVYAIVPGLSDATVAARDPLFSAGYDNLGQTSGAGSRIYIDGGAGLAAGWYTLLPAKYAVLPGGVRVVEQPGGPGLQGVASVKLPDGTVRVSGRYGQLGTEDWRWRNFDLQTQDVFRSYSNIALTSAQKIFADRAKAAGEVTPRLPFDAGSIALNAVTKLNLDGTVKAAAAKGGRGALVDVGGSAIYVVANPDATTVADGTVLADGAVVRQIDGALVLCADAASACAAGAADRLADVAPLLVGADDLSVLGAETLLIGGSRVTRADGAVEIRTSAQRVVVANDAETPLYAPEILVAVGLAQNELVDNNFLPVPPTTATQVSRDVREGPSKSLLVLDGAVIEARGTVADTSTADYVAAGGYVGSPGAFRRASVGAVLRVANGPERLIRREDTAGDAFETPTDDLTLLASYQRRYAVDLDIADSAKLTGTSVLADVGTYRNPTLSKDAPAVTDEFGSVITPAATGWTPRADLSIGRGAAITANVLTLGAGRVAITDRAVADGGLAVTRDLVAGLGSTGKVGRLSLVSQQAIGIDGGVWQFGDLSLTAPGLTSRDGGDVTIRAGSFGLANAAAKLTACTGAACGDATLAIDAREIVMGPGQVAANGFGGGVTLSASAGLFARGVGGLDVGSAALTVNTPLIADRAFPNADATDLTIPATGLTLASDGAVRISGAASATAPTTPGAPGAIIAIEGGSVAISGTRIRATAGSIDISASTGDLTLSNGAVVETPGYERVFGEVTRSSPGGKLRLESVRGDVVVGAGTTVSVGGGKGKAGALALVASEGEVVVAGLLDGKAREGDASLQIDTGAAFDLSGFAATSVERNFDGRIAIRSGAGDLTLASGRTLRGTSVALTADGGRVDLAGLIDTSGITGGDVALYGDTGVRLRNGARIDTSASGYAVDDSRRAKSGSVAIGTDGAGVIQLDAGSTIHVAADRGHDRLVPFRRNGQTYYYHVAADQGGTVSLRAPIIEREGADTVNVTANGRVEGAHEIVLEAFKRWDLDAIADSGQFSGVTRDANGDIVLDVRTDLDQLAFDARTGRVTIVDAGQGVNLLGDRGDGTVVSYIQDFDVSGAFGGLGSLADDANFHARPGIELVSEGNVTLASNWNLGAGVVDEVAAKDDGLMTIDPVVKKLGVVFGREGDLLRDYTAMTYRTGGRATGEAGVLSLRAGGDLKIKGTISDGFFQFRNQTDPDFLAVAAAGGKQYYRISPDVQYSTDPSLPPDVWTPGVGPGGNFVTIDFNLFLGSDDLARTDRPSTAPYSAEANTAAAIGNDAAGSAELFPLLDGDEAMGASSYRLVAGADRDSVDPGKTQAGATGTVSVEGLNRYEVTPGSADQVRLVDPTLGLRSDGFGVPRGAIDAVLASISSRINGLNDDSFVSIGGFFDDAVVAQLGQIAIENLPPGSFSYIEPDFQTTSSPQLTMRFGSVRPFLDAVTANIGQLAQRIDPFSLPNPPGGQRTAYYRNIVRTGAGRIDIAAAGSVDLRGEEAVTAVNIRDDTLVTNPGSGGTANQIGGSAVYSAGQRAVLGVREARDPSGRRVTVDLGALPPPPNSLRDNLPTFTYEPRPADGGTPRGAAGILVGDLAFAENGGDVTIAAGEDVLSRRDYARAISPVGFTARSGEVTGDAVGRINAQAFYDGVGALAGGDVRIEAEGDVSDVTAVATSGFATAVTTADGLAASRALVTFGAGDVTVAAGRDVVGGVVEVGSGRGTIDAGRSLVSAGAARIGIDSVTNALSLRLTDATIDVTAKATVVLNGIESLYYYAEASGVSLTANGDLLVRNPTALPGSFRAVSAAGDLTMGATVVNGRGAGNFVLAPSPLGELELLAAGDIAPVTIGISDQDPSLLAGVFTPARVQDGSTPPPLTDIFNFSPFLTEGERRSQHAENSVHRGNPNPVLIAAGRDINGMILVTPKQARVSAGRDIVDMVFFGQNLDARDITRISAGRDITATTRLLAGAIPPFDVPTEPRAAVQGNTFQIGGPGSFIFEAGRNAGPFLNSASVRTVDSRFNLVDVDYGGGILSVGNESNPWLAAEGADVSVMFGVGKGVAWSALRDYYLDPANLTNLDDALFEQGDRTRPIYAPRLITWMKANAPEALEAAAGEGEADFAAAFAGFKTLSELRQRAFLTELYFNELRATADPSGPSFQQYKRGYEAVNLLFPAKLGYTENNLDGGSNGANERVLTGNLDLRLATIQTSRGGDINIFGPGGNVLAGSVVRTAQQITRRNYDGGRLFGGFSTIRPIDAIPVGFEGVLTVRGGAINSFTDGDVLLNQSRLFTQGGGDISLWSSNGDLNGGEGPKTASNFPPVTVDVSYNGFSIIDSRGSATGAGIAAFQPTVGVEAPDVFLVAPRGTVDVGAAGIRVAGNLNIAALQVVNADNISVGGVTVGVPTVATAPVGALTAANNATAAAGQDGPEQAAGGDQASIIIVEVLGYGGGDGQRTDCPEDDPECKPQP